ncbi:MAG: FeoA domain-containing protein [Candidatus Cloacimonetes bacterium]|nr:FeoA domain-containing protein [Candidatus Cloacimonadota bacterium]
MLSNRHRVRLRNWGRRLTNQKPQCRRLSGECLSLEQVPEGRQATVYCNSDLRTIERGLACGASVYMIRNETEEPNLIVAVGDARYVLDRRVAHKIRVRIG